jgi:predicted  nucleic acid-binding Zn-ribbon protein
VNAALASVIALQRLDTAADHARRRMTEIPAAEQALAAALAEKAAGVDRVKARQTENTTARRALEKDVAATDTRLARFDDHKAAVKTNQEYTALLHEIATAKSEKDAVEEKILVLMDAADGLTAELKTEQAALAEAQRDADKTKQTLGAERSALEQELARLQKERDAAVVHVDKRTLALYEQLLKGRRGIAVARMTGEICDACHVRLRPHVSQVIRRNEEIIQCESCQRILYYEPPAATAAASPAQV